jgi:hypothetical protein
MRTTLFRTRTTRIVGMEALRLPSANMLRLLALAAIVALAAGLRVANLEALGYANHYYAAAVKSMLQSWHNFFFVTAEPGGAVSVDKPPLGLWFQAIPAYFFGSLPFDPPAVWDGGRAAGGAGVSNYAGRRRHGSEQYG